LARLLGRRPQVGVGLGVPGDPQPRRVDGPPEGGPEIERLGPGHMLDEPEQIGPGGRERTPDVVLTEPVELPEKGVTGVLEVEPQVVLVRIRIGHAPNLPVPGPRPHRISRSVDTYRSPAASASRSKVPLSTARRSSLNPSTGS